MNRQVGVGENHNEETDYRGQKYRVERVHKGGHPGDAEARERKRKARDDKIREMRDEANEAAISQPSLFGGNDDDGDY